MPKTAPTITNSPQVTQVAQAATVQRFREETHRGHPLTRVGTYQDLDLRNEPYEVWYCQ